MNAAGRAFRDGPEKVRTMPSNPVHPAEETAPQTDRATEVALAKALWTRDFGKTNPDAAPEERREGWSVARGEYIRAGRQLLRNLNRAGFVITPPATAAVE